VRVLSLVEIALDAENQLANHVFKYEKQVSANADYQYTNEQKSNHVLMLDRLHKRCKAKRGVNQYKSTAFIKHLHPVHKRVFKWLVLQYVDTCNQGHCGDHI